MKPTHARYWVVVFALALAMIMYIQRVAISQAIVPIAVELNLNQAQKGIILGAFGLSYALFEIPMGLLGDKLGVRRVLSLLVLFWSLFTALTGAAWSMVSLWIARFVFGAGEAGCFPNLTRMLSAWLPVGERVKAQAVMWAFGRWGGALAPPVAVFVIYHLGWRLGFVALAVLGVAWVVFFFPWFRDDPAEHKSVNKAELVMLEDSRSLVLHDHGMPWYRLLLQRDIAFLGLQYFGFSYTWYFYVTWLPTWLQQARGLSPLEAAGYATLPLAAGGFGSIISGFLPLSIPRKLVAIGGFFTTAILICIILHASLVFVAFETSALSIWGFSKPKRTAAVIGSTQKTAALGLPLLAILFRDDPAIGLLALPLLIYHPLQLAVAGALVDRWRRYNGVDTPLEPTA